MRILHVLPGMSPGGMENLVIQLAADACGRRDEVVVASAAGPWVGRVTAAGASHRRLPATGRGTSAVPTAAAAVTVLASTIARIRPDVIHAHNVRATAMARFAAAAAPARPALVSTVHGLAPADYRAASRILRMTGQRVIACAPAVGRSLERAGFPENRIAVICNGVRLDPATTERMVRLRAALGLPADEARTRLIVGIGRLVTQKNWPLLISAAAGVDDAIFVVAGDGPLRQPLTDLARRSGGRVRFVGVIDDVAALVGLASCVVCTSSWEGLPLATLEALSLGAPVVATAVDGITDLVPANAAVLVPAGDPAAIAAAIGRVLASQQLVAQLRANALTAATRWEPRTMLAAYQHAYRAAIAELGRA